MPADPRLALVELWRTQAADYRLHAKEMREQLAPLSASRLDGIAIGLASAADDLAELVAKEAPRG